MSDKERLEYIEEQVQELLTLADSEGCGEANLLAIYNDMVWLIEQAEKVERYEKARQSYLQACDELEGHADIVRSIISELRAALEGEK